MIADTDTLFRNFAHHVVYEQVSNLRSLQLDDGLDLSMLTPTQMGNVKVVKVHHVSANQTIRDGPPSFRVRICKSCCKKGSLLELGTYIDHESAILVNDVHEINNNRFDHLTFLTAADQPYFHLLNANLYDRNIKLRKIQILQAIHNKLAINDDDDDNTKDDNNRSVRKRKRRSSQSSPLVSHTFSQLALTSSSTSQSPLDSIVTISQRVIYGKSFQICSDFSLLTSLLSHMKMPVESISSSQVIWDRSMHVSYNQVSLELFDHDELNEVDLMQSVTAYLNQVQFKSWFDVFISRMPNWSKTSYDGQLSCLIFKLQQVTSSIQRLLRHLPDSMAGLRKTCESYVIWHVISLIHSYLRLFDYYYYSSDSSVKLEYLDSISDLIFMSESCDLIIRLSPPDQLEYYSAMLSFSVEKAFISLDRGERVKITNRDVKVQEILSELLNAFSSTCHDETKSSPQTSSCWGLFPLDLHPYGQDERKPVMLLEKKIQISCLLSQYSFLISDFSEICIRLNQLLTSLLELFRLINARSENCNIVFMSVNTYRSLMNEVILFRHLNHVSDESNSLGPLISALITAIVSIIRHNNAIQDMKNYCYSDWILKKIFGILNEMDTNYDMATSTTTLDNLDDDSEFERMIDQIVLPESSGKELMKTDSLISFGSLSQEEWGESEL